jgi:polyhydroxyalkanoate synthesis regulator phasin
MEDIVRKALLMGAGIGMIAEEKIDAYLEKLEAMGILDKKEARKLANDALADKKKQAKKFERQIDQRVDELLKGAGMVRKSDYDKLEKKVDKLKEQLGALSKKKASQPVKKAKKPPAKKAGKPRKKPKK